MPLWFTLLCAASVIAYAMVGGVLMAFSDFIMRSLNLVKDQSGVEVMQVINIKIMRSAFMLLFLGLAPVSLIIAFYAGFALDGPPARLLMLAGGLYLAGVFAVTAAANVPLNNQLAAFDPATPQAFVFWKQAYVTRWIGWNSLRTFSCMVSAGLTVSALVIR